MEANVPDKAPEMQTLKIAILTVSDTRTLADDTSGQYLQDAAQEAGHTIAARAICTDDKYLIRAHLSQWIADNDVNAVLTTGGTGFYLRDITPEAASVLFDKDILGFGEVFRAISLEEIGMSTLQSRATAGMANDTAIFCLPGSTNACKTAWTKILADQLNSITRPCNFVAHLIKNR